ncbi:MAG: TetR/AcrR family transcriptional regulator [Stackebrandtia sp.]
MGDAPQVPVKRMPRAERREQILAAATRAFARSGYAATGLDDVATEAGISKVILYRHFESKADLYKAVLTRTCDRLADTVGTDHHDADSIPALLRAADTDPDGFRLLFRYAATEPAFRSYVSALTGDSFTIAHRQLTDKIPDPQWAQWAARLAPQITIDAVLAWLDAGQPDPDTAAARITHTITALIDAARMRTTDEGQATTRPK